MAVSALRVESALHQPAAEVATRRSNVITPLPACSPPGTQVVACQRWVSQLRSNLATLAEKCGGLEEANRAALRSQDTPNCKELGEKHAKLMVSIRPFLVSEEDSVCPVDFQSSVADKNAASHGGTLDMEPLRAARQLLEQASQTADKASKPLFGRGDTIVCQPQTPVHRLVILPEKTEARKNLKVDSAIPEGNDRAGQQRTGTQLNGGHSAIPKANPPQQSAPLRFHDVRVPAPASESPPPGVRPSYQSALRDGANATPGSSAPQPSLETPRGQALRGTALASSFDGAAESADVPDQESDAGAEGDAVVTSSTVDRVEMIRKQAFALASSIGNSLGSLLGGRATSAPPAADKPAIAGHGAAEAASNEEALLWRSGHSGRFAAPSLPQFRDPHEREQLPNRHLSAPPAHRGLAGRAEESGLRRQSMGRSAPTGSHAISDVWARHHPSRNGGVSPAWWGPATPFASEPRAVGNNSGVAVGVATLPWPSATQAIYNREA